ncbi:MAG: 6-pyruvoyl-tetrahydropterin synthase-related protein [Thermoflexales bacterium]
MRTAAESRRLAAELALILGVALIASVGLWSGPGILNTRAGGDSPFLLQRVYELALNLRQGVIPARWMPDAAFGLGYPFFNFYAAFPYYLASGLSVAGVDLLVAIKLTQTLGMAAAGLAMWLWLRDRLTGAGPLFGAIAYILAPFHLVNVYVRGDSLSEFYAFIFFPLILLGIERVALNSRWRDVTALALSIAGLLVTHNVSAMLFAPFCALYALMAVAAPQLLALPGAASPPWIQRELGRLFVAVGFGLALSAWFWIPALAEASGAQLGDQTTGFFSFANHFRGSNLIQGTLEFDYAIDGARTPFAMGLAQVLVIAGGAVFGIALSARRRIPIGFLIACIVGIGLATFLVLPLSEPVWRAIPPLGLAQFPWRLLSVQAAFGAALVGCAGVAVTGLRARTLAAVALALALSVVMLGRLPSARLNIVAADVSADSIADYEWLSGNIGTTIRAEYLPAAVLPRPAVGPAMIGMNRARALAGVLRDSRQVGATGVGQTWDLSVGQGGATIALPLLYWDAWEASARDAAGIVKAVALTSAPRLGWTRAEMPEGEWRLDVRYRPTPAQRTGELISLLALAIGAVWAVWRGLSTGGWRRFQPVLRNALAVGFAILLAGWGLGALVENPAGVARLVDYTDRPFAHRGPILLGVGESNPYVLAGASVIPVTASPGEIVTVTLLWRNGRMPPGMILEEFAPSHGLGGWPLATQVFRVQGAQAQFAGESTSIRILDGMPAGPSLFRLLRQTPGGALEYVGAVLGPRILARASAVIAPPLRSFAPELPITLAAFGWRETNPGRVCLFPTWVLSEDDSPYALKYSLRLRGPDGRILAQVDQEPMQGFAPTWSWTAGVPIRDGACDVSLAAGLNPGDPFEVEIVWYDAATLAQVARTSLRSLRLSDPAAPNIADPGWVTGIP